MTAAEYGRKREELARLKKQKKYVQDAKLLVMIDARIKELTNEISDAHWFDYHHYRAT